MSALRPIRLFKVDAFLADTTHMSAEQLGCYLRLLSGVEQPLRG
jgi:hypothetical protein